MSDAHITLERRYATSRRRVFDAWTRPRQLRRWAFGAADRATKSVWVELFPGGRWELSLRAGIDGDRRWGTYREVHVPDRLVFTWTTNAPPFEGAATEVTVDIEGGEFGSTVVLTHTGLPDAERDARRAAWSRLLEDLKGFLHGS